MTSENLRFGMMMAGLVTLIISVIVGTISVQTANSKDNQNTREMIRDNAENSKDMMALIEAVNGRVTAIENSRWSKDNEAENAARNAIANPGIRYADPKNPGSFFFVQKNLP